MEQLDLFIQNFYAMPTVDKIVNSHGILRLAVLQYGKPLFLITCAFLFLVTILVLSRLKPKKGRPKKIKEPKPAKASKKAPRKVKKARGTPKSVMKNLAKIPDSPLPLYPVADKRKPLAVEDDMQNMGAMPVMPVMDDASLIADLDQPEAAMPAPKPVVASQPVQSFTLDSTTAASIMGTASSAPEMPSPQDMDAAPQANAAIEDDFNIPESDLTGLDDALDAHIEDDPFNIDLASTEINHEPASDQDDDISINMEDIGNIDGMVDNDSGEIEDEPYFTDAPAPEMGQSSAPRHEVTVDVSPIGGDDFEMPIGSFGSDDQNTETDGLSASAQQKLAELNERDSS